MAKVFQMTPEQEMQWMNWAYARPECIRDLALKFRPDTLYQMKSTGHRVTLFSISENRTLTVSVSGKFNFVAFERRVFGINPDDLEECELPSQDELTGSIGLSIDEVRALIATSPDIPSHSPLPPYSRP